MEDFRYLAQHLLEELNRGESRQFNGFGDDVWDKFAEYNWPGNVDELLAVIREARAACNEPLIRAKDLPFRFRTGLDAQSVGPVIRPQVVTLGALSGSGGEGADRTGAQRVPSQQEPSGPAPRLDAWAAVPPDGNPRNSRPTRAGVKDSALERREDSSLG